MTPETPYPILLAAIAWSALIVSFVVVRYMNMPDKLYELVSKGDVNVVAGHIEEAEVMPAIVTLIRKVLVARDAKTAQGVTVVYEEILEEVDFRPDLDAAQKALGKIGEIHSSIDRLTDYSGPIWQLGLFHLFVVLGAAADYLFIQDPLRMPLLWNALTAGALTLILILALIVRYERRYKSLLKHLRTNRGR